MLLPTGHPAQSFIKVLSGEKAVIDESWSTDAGRRVAALTRLSAALRLRSWQAQLLTLQHVWDPPRMRVYDVVTFHHRAVIEVRHGVGGDDWFAFRDSDLVARADAPKQATECLSGGDQHG